jgi:ribosomal protein S18 acetylase RimI-like enzyme
MLFREVKALPLNIIIRAAVSQDSDAIARIFLESAEYHARIDPERYLVPSIEAVSARYRDQQQHPVDTEGRAITLVAELSGEIIGFIDVRLEQSPDPMHRRIVYCHIVEIAVGERYHRQGAGRQLLAAAEEWGRHHGADFASLEYLVANTRAGRFYQDRMGYSAAATIAIKPL